MGNGQQIDWHRRAICLGTLYTTGMHYWAFIIGIKGIRLHCHGAKGGSELGDVTIV